MRALTVCSAKIKRDINDSYRQNANIHDLEFLGSAKNYRGHKKSKILKALKSFSKFTRDNDPYHEHDGCIIFCSEGFVFFWRICADEIDGIYYPKRIEISPPNEVKFT